MTSNLNVILADTQVFQCFMTLELFRLSYLNWFKSFSSTVRHLGVNYKDVLSLSSVDKIFAGKLSLILHKWPISAESALYVCFVPFIPPKHAPPG